MAEKTDLLKPDIRSWCLPLPPQWPERMQLDRLTGEVYTPGQHNNGRDKLVGSVRHGSIVEVVDAFLLATPLGRTDTRKRDLVAAMDEIEDRGGIIRELSTGDETPRGRRRMRNRAFDMITAHAKGRRSAVNGALSTGAPRTWPREGPLFDGYRMIWESRRYKNDDQRLTAIQKNFGDCPSRQWLRNAFGSPHKLVDPNTEPEPAVKPKKIRRRKCYAYFIWDGVKVKIGHSNNPHGVVKALRRGNHRELTLLGVCDGGAQREIKLHAKFKHFRGRGEWFKLAPEIKRYIARYAKNLPKS